MVKAAGLQVFGNVGVEQPDLASARVGVGFPDARLAAPQRLDLAAGERNAGLEHLADLVVEARLAVVGDDPQFAVCFRRHQISLLDSADLADATLQRNGSLCSGLCFKAC